MAFPVLHPLSEGERRQLCDILHFTEDERVWKYLCEAFRPIFAFSADTDLFRERMMECGQAMFHHMLFMLQTRFSHSLFTYKHSSKTLMFRYVWLEVDKSSVHVVNKGSIWYDSSLHALSAGRKYRPSLDCPASHQQQIILTVESLCHCQLMTSSLTDDVYAIDNCQCGGEFYLSRRKLAQHDSSSFFHAQTCILRDNKRILVIRLPATIIDSYDNVLYCFCIPRSDTYFMSRSKRIGDAFKTYLKNS